MTPIERYTEELKSLSLEQLVEKSSVINDAIIQNINNKMERYNTELLEELDLINNELSAR